MKPIQAWALLGAVLCVAFGLRVWGMGYDLPHIYHPDEPSYVSISQHIFKTGELNPGFFHFSSLLFYLNALAYIPFYLGGSVLGVFQSTADILPPVAVAMGVVQAPTPAAVLLGRAVSILFGVATVFMASVVGKRISGRAAVGLLAALVVAIEPSSVWHSRLITPDTLVTFFVLCTLWASVRIFERGRAWDYVLAGLFVGLSASSKYNGALAMLPVVAAHFLHVRSPAQGFHWLVLAGVSSLVGFVVTTPYSILDYPAFLRDLNFEIHHYSTGHPGMEGAPFRWYVLNMWSTGGLLFPMAFLGMLLGFVRQRRATLLLSAFPVLYFVFICNFAVRNDRTFLPMIPYLAILAAWFAVQCWDHVRQMRPAGYLAFAKPVFVSVLAFALLAIPLSKSIADGRELGKPDSRELARGWIAKNLPAASKVAFESYAPFMDGSQLSLQPVSRLIDHDADWYAANGFQYLVFSQGMFGRFYADPPRYPDEIAQYDALFDRFERVAEFPDDKYTIRVYRVR